MTNPSHPFIQGLISATPFVLILIPFSMLFGIFAAELDLSAIETTAFSVFVLAGASQIASLTILSEGEWIFFAILTGALLNIRMLLYSAALAPHLSKLSLKERLLISYALVDQCFVLCQRKFENVPEWSLTDKRNYYLGISALILPLWFSASLIGYFFGGLIPSHIDISYGLPLAFIALIAPSLKSIPHLIAAMISVIGGVGLNFLPNNIGLIISALIAILVAAEVEKRLEGSQ